MNNNKILTQMHEVVGYDGYGERNSIPKNGKTNLFSSGNFKQQKTQLAQLEIQWASCAET